MQSRIFSSSPPLALAFALAAEPQAPRPPTSPAATAPGRSNQTYGVHNPPSASPCAADLRLSRPARQPSDPQYPHFWQSRWTMYRVYNNYQRHMPPYDGRPPLPLRPGRDYEVSSAPPIRFDLARPAGEGIGR